MSLEEILDDIKEGVTLTTENIIIKDVSLVSLNSSNTKKHFIPPIDKETINRLNQIVNLIVYKENIVKMDKVDKGLAMEVFTMLPDVSAADKAKLTTSPSLINKEILDKIINVNLKNSISLIDGIITEIQKNKSVILEVKETLQEIKEYIFNFKSILEDAIAKHENNPIIVIDVSKKQDNQANLLTDPIAKISLLNDYMFQYEKFANNIAKRYNSILDDNSLKELLKNTKYNLENIVIRDFIGIADELLSMIKIKENILDGYLNKIEEININNDKLDYVEVKNTIELNELVVAAVEYINKLNEIVKNKENVFEKVIELLEFLKNC